MRTTAIMNLKGGTAKTITAINTAAILSKIYGHKVLLVDADSQGNLSEFTAANPTALPMAKGTSSLLRGDVAGPIPTKMRDVLLIHGDEDLMELDVSAARSGIANPMAIRDLLDNYAVDDLFDNVIIDCPPAFSASAMAALAAADEVVIPVTGCLRDLRTLADRVPGAEHAEGQSGSGDRRRPADDVRGGI